MKTICFTGFGKKEKNELMEIAEKRGFIVKGDVIKGLCYLCCGENAGPSKISKAKQNLVHLIISNHSNRGVAQQEEFVDD